MNVDEIIKFIETSDEETDSLLASALKQKKKKPRIMVSHVIKEDSYRLAQALPKTTTEFNGKRFAMTCARYIRELRDLNDVILHSYALKPSDRGYPVWTSHESLKEDKTEDYKLVFHELTNTVLDLMNQYGTKY